MISHLLDFETLLAISALASFGSACNPFRGSSRSGRGISHVDVGHGAVGVVVARWRLRRGKVRARAGFGLAIRRLENQTVEWL